MTSAEETQPTGDVAEFKKLSLEELMGLDITSASRKEEKLMEAPAAVYVIGWDEIRRSGATSIPEALRLAPGVEVARVGSHSWAISIRGFTGDLSNKLLVLIDGRSVYSPLYAGVFWDVQDILLEDIDRIEVVAGPGGTMWGANAVNGVINIITRSSKETRGGYFELGAGNEERGFGGFQYGGRIGNSAHARGYAKHFERDSSDALDGSESEDDWRMTRVGFRIDWDTKDSDVVTFQGDMYSGVEGGLFRDEFTLGTVPGPSHAAHSNVGGGNVMARWTRQTAQESNLRLQVYYDHTSREIPGTYDERRDTFDVDFQHDLQLGDRHELLWGVGFRVTGDDLSNTLFATFDPARRIDRTFSPFVQDKIDLWDGRLFLTLGSKFEHNNYSGFEVQPNVRMSYVLSQRQTSWAAVSRAVRIPSRLDSDLQLTAPLSIPDIPFPVYAIINGTDEFGPEELIAYEAGYRLQIHEDLTFDLAAFFNDYDNLQTFEPATPIVLPDPSVPYLLLPNFASNGMEGESYGSTFVVNWQPLERWRWQFQYTLFHLELRNKQDSRDTSSQNVEGNSPANQFSAFSFFDLSRKLSLFTGLRFVGEIPNQNISAYTELDLNLIWQLGNELELAIGARNFLNDRHLEFGGNQMERGVMAKVSWRF
jgi:iron complex outermembrane receptor protein